MANVTLYVSDELKKRMAAHTHIRWSRAFSDFVEGKLDDFEEAERLAKNSRVTQADVDFYSKKVDRAAAKHARELFDEGSR